MSLIISGRQQIVQTNEGAQHVRFVIGDDHVVRAYTEKELKELLEKEK
jgi:hypothetical protein